MIQKLKNELVEICKLLYMRKLTTARGGNVSTRIIGTTAKSQIIITPQQTSLFDVSLDNLVLANIDGRIVEGGLPSTEMPMHCAIYQTRPDIDAIVHTHSFYSTLYSTLEKPIELLTAESKILVGEQLPLVEYAEAGSETLAKRVAACFKEHIACLLARHGLVVGGSSLKDAYYLAEIAEEAAKLNFFIKLREKPP